MSAELERGPEARRLALELVVALELGRWPVDVLDPEAVPGELIEVLSLLVYGGVWHDPAGAVGPPPLPDKATSLARATEPL